MLVMLQKEKKNHYCFGYLIYNPYLNIWVSFNSSSLYSEKPKPNQTYKLLISLFGYLKPALYFLILDRNLNQPQVT